MKKDETIASLSIDDFIAFTGQTKPVHDFHVFKSEELNKEKAPFRPGEN